MANTIAYQAPRLHGSGPLAEDDPNINKYPFTGTLVEADIVFLNSGVATKAAANQASIAGMVLAPSANNYHAASSAGVGLNFGPDQTGTALVPATEQNLGVMTFGGGILLEISLNQATTLANSLIGTQVGLGYDAGSGFFFADPTAGNKIGVIQMLPGGPDAPRGAQVGNGQIGDLGGRVVISFIASALQV